MSEIESAQDSYQDFKSSTTQSEVATPSIERSDLAPRLIDPGETEIVFQRHGDFVRDPESLESGHLKDCAIEEEYNAAEEFITKQLELIPEDQRSTVDFIFLASDTQYGLDGGRRSMETADLVMLATKKVLEKFGLSESQIRNISGDLKGDGGSRPTQKLREPSIFTESPDFVNYLDGRYLEEINGKPVRGKKWWTAYEEDVHEDIREKLGAEGPDHLADRLQKQLDILARYSKAYHSSNPGRRLVIWGTTHYDTISPFVKRNIYKVGKDHWVDVKYGSGIAIKIDKEGAADTLIADKPYQVPINFKS